MRVPSRLPRGTRLLAVGFVVLLVTSGLGFGLFVYEPAPETPDRPLFLAEPGEPLPAPNLNESYRVTVKLDSNYPQVSSQRVIRQKEYIPGKTPIVKDSQVTTGNSDVVQYVTYRTGERQYVRKTYNDAAAFERRLENTDFTQVDRTTLTYYAVNQSRDPGDTIRPGQALKALYMLRYERVGETTYKHTEVVKYRAVQGWTTRERLGAGKGDESVYVRQARGFVLVNPDSGAILKAEVSGSVVKANTWADVMTAKSYSVSVVYDVDTGIDDVSKPPWVGELGHTNETAKSTSKSVASQSTRSDDLHAAVSYAIGAA